jgi:hypothetical protein
MVDPREFFKSLYAKPVEIMPQVEYDATVSRLVSRIGGNTVVGDQALQSLMVNFVLSNASSLEQVKGLSVALAGIKQRAVSEIAQAFPNANLDELVNAAKTAGYEVSILKQ